MESWWQLPRSNNVKCKHVLYSFVGNPSISWEPQKGELHLSNTKRKFSTMDKSWQSAHPRHKRSQSIYINYILSNTIYTNIMSYFISFGIHGDCFHLSTNLYTFVSNVILDVVFFGICWSSQATLSKMTGGSGIQKIFLEQENNECSFPFPGSFQLPTIECLIKTLRSTSCFGLFHHSLEY